MEIIAAFVQLYREDSRYLHRICKWVAKVGLEWCQDQMADLATRRAGDENRRRMRGGARAGAGRFIRTGGCWQRCLSGRNRWPWRATIWNGAAKCRYARCGGDRVRLSECGGELYPRCDSDGPRGVGGGTWRGVGGWHLLRDVQAATGGAAAPIQGGGGCGMTDFGVRSVWAVLFQAVLPRAGIRSRRRVQAGAQQGVVSLVGAGAGSADLITLRGVRWLQAADVVFSGFSRAGPKRPMR
jgi:hypothetical protein